MISTSDTHLLKFFFGNDFQPAARPALGLRRFLMINNPDGTLRWVFPENCRAETLLSLYNGAGWRGRIFSKMLRLAFFLKKPNWLAAGHFWAKPLENEPDFAIFTGTVGLNRKLVVSFRGRFFEKIPTTPDAARLTDAEFFNLKHLENLHLQKSDLPKIEKTARGGILQNSVRPQKTLPGPVLSPRHRAALDEIFSKTRRETALRSTVFLKKIRENLADFDGCPTNDFTRRAAPLRQLLENLLLKIDPEEIVPVGLAHGDFTPWNCFLPADPAGKLAIYDWELALPDAPAGFDALHFTVQSGVLLRRLPLGKLMGEVISEVGRAGVSPKLVGWYVLFTASYYLPKYARQVDLHGQVWWLLGVWERLASEAFQKDNNFTG